MEPCGACSLAAPSGPASSRACSTSCATADVAVFEDVHWADEATLDLLGFLARRLTRCPTLLVLTYRDDELGPRHPLRLILGDLAIRPWRGGSA